MFITDRVPSSAWKVFDKCVTATITNHPRTRSKKCRSAEYMHSKNKRSIRCSSPSAFLLQLFLACLLVTEILLARSYCESAFASIRIAAKSTRWMLTRFAIWWQQRRCSTLFTANTALTCNAKIMLSVLPPGNRLWTLVRASRLRTFSQQASSTGIPPEFTVHDPLLRLDQKLCKRPQATLFAWKILSSSALFRLTF